MAQHGAFANFGSTTGALTIFGINMPTSFYSGRRSHNGAVRFLSNLEF
jgi:hypothetical protein